MGVVVNGIMLYGGLKLFLGVFFVFLDYMKLLICLVIMMKILSVFIFLYDLVVVGEDGLIYELIE